MIEEVKQRGSVFEQMITILKEALVKETYSCPIRHKRLNDEILITRGMYVLLGGEPGTGKTAVADSTFVLDIFDDWLKSDKSVDLRWIYRSMERPAMMKQIKWLSYKLLTDYNLNISVNDLLNFKNSKKKVTDEIIGLSETYSDYFSELLERCTIIGGPASPYDISDTIKKEMAKYGTVQKVGQYNSVFNYHNPNTHVFHITDHIGLCKKTSDLKSDKEVIDKLCEKTMEFRDFYNGTVVDISQLNRNLNSMDRLKAGAVDVSRDDFKSSSNTFENADLVLGLLNPFKLNLTEYEGFNKSDYIYGNHNFFRVIRVIKNSYGSDDFKVPFYFHGATGYIEEIPKPDYVNGKLTPEAKMIIGNSLDKFKKKLT